MPRKRFDIEDAVLDGFEKLDELRAAAAHAEESFLDAAELATQQGFPKWAAHLKRWARDADKIFRRVDALYERSARERFYTE